MNSTRTPVPEISFAAVLGRIVEHHRTSRGIHQVELAGRLGISQGAYSRLESGQTGMAVTQLRVVAHQLGASPAELLSEAEQYADSLRRRGAQVTDSRQGSSTGGLLIALGILAVLLASKK